MRLFQVLFLQRAVWGVDYPSNVVARTTRTASAKGFNSSLHLGVDIHVLNIYWVKIVHMSLWAI